MVFVRWGVMSVGACMIPEIGSAGTAGIAKSGGLRLQGQEASLKEFEFVTQLLLPEERVAGH